MIIHVSMCDQPFWISAFPCCLINSIANYLSSFCCVKLNTYPPSLQFSKTLILIMLRIADYILNTYPQYVQYSWLLNTYPHYVQYCWLLNTYPHYVQYSWLLILIMFRIAEYIYILIMFSIAEYLSSLCSVQLNTSVQQ